MEDVRQGLGSGRGGEALQTETRILRLLLSRKDTAKPGEEMEELKVAWDMLGSAQLVSAQSSAHLLATLVEAGLLDSSQTITQLLASLSHGTSFQGIVPALGQILTLQIESCLKKNGGTYVCPYAISSSQHPFISVLRSTPSAWGLVLDQCVRILEHPHQDAILTFLRPVLLYLFCDPNYHAHFGAMRAALFDRLLEGCSADNGGCLSRFFTSLAQVMGWLQLDNRAGLAEMGQYVGKFFTFLLQAGGDEADSHVREWVPLLACLSYRQAVLGQEPTRTVRLLERVLRERPDICANWDLEVVLLARVMEAAAHTHHQAVVELALELVQQNLTSQIPTGILVVSCLQSLSFDTSLSPAATNAKAALVRLYYTRDWREPSPAPRNVASRGAIAPFEELVSEAAATVRAANVLASCDKLRLNWLEKMKKLEHRNLSQFLPLLASLFLGASSAEDVKLCLDLLLACVKESASHSPLVLTVVLHKMAKVTSSTTNSSSSGNSPKSPGSGDPTLRQALLQALPSLAGERSCVALLLRLVGSLSAKPSMASLRLSLLSKLWRVEPRCFQFLHKALEETPPESFFTEFQITRALVIKGIVSSHAAQYGSELLPILSGILNQCHSVEVTLAATLALESIFTLIQEAVIDIRTTIKVLAPKLTRDTRPEVLVRYCRLLGLAPTFRVAGPEYAAFLTDSLTWLWRTADSSATGGLAHPAVSAAAYSAIGAFPLEATKLKMLPAAARAGLKLPPKYCATPAEAARRPEDVLPYVPAECWPRLLMTGAAGSSEQQAAAASSPQLLEGVKGLLAALVRQELDNLPRSVYHLSQAMQNAGAEPVSYNHLPDHSVLRGLVGYLLQQRELPRPHLSDGGPLAACLAVLARPHPSRPLPPLDWSSLEYMLDSVELNNHFVNIIARQAPHSRSARLILERQLAGGLDADLAAAYCLNLELLGQAVPPGPLGTFLNATLQRSLRTAVESADYTRVQPLLDALKSALRSKDLPEHILLVIAGAVESLYDLVPTDSEVFGELLSVAALLPTKHLERLSSPASWWELTPIKLFRAASLRTQLALSGDTETPLTWLNEVLEAGGKLTGDCSFLLRSLTAVMTYSRTKSSQVNTSWLLELMGQLSGLLRKTVPGHQMEQGFSFLVDSFCVAVIVFADQDSLCIPRDQLCHSRACRTALFPVALCRLAGEQPGLAGQLATWSLQLARRSDLPHGIGDLFRSCLRVFKHSASWPEATMWGRLVLA